MAGNLEKLTHAHNLVRVLREAKRLGMLSEAQAEELQRYEDLLDNVRLAALEVARAK